MNHAATLQPSSPWSKALRSPINWLLVFVPVTAVLEHLSAVPAPVIFFSAALAIIPIAAVIVRATDNLQHAQAMPL